MLKQPNYAAAIDYIFENENIWDIMSFLGVARTDGISEEIELMTDEEKQEFCDHFYTEVIWE